VVRVKIFSRAGSSPRSLSERGSATGPRPGATNFCLRVRGVRGVFSTFIQRKVGRRCPHLAVSVEPALTWLLDQLQKAEGKNTPHPTSSKRGGGSARHSPNQMTEPRCDNRAPRAVGAAKRVCSTLTARWGHRRPTLRGVFTDQFRSSKILDKRPAS
jgi:hypothetical protein